MFCKNCGKEIKDGSSFCTECGAKAIETPPTENSATPNTTVATKKMSKGKMVLIAVFVVLVIIVVACAVGGSSDSEGSGTNNEIYSNLNDSEVEQQILSILNTTPLTDGYSTTIGMAMNAAFVDYEMTYKLATGFEHTYNVTFSGTYYPNPEVPQYTNTGSITYSVNLETGDCIAKSDFGGIEDVLLAYAVNYLS